MGIVTRKQKGKALTWDEADSNFKQLEDGLANKLDKADAAIVAKTGEYSDLKNKPVLAEVAISGEYSDLAGTPSLSAVATSGSYSDLTDKPEIPVAPVRSVAGKTGDVELAATDISGLSDVATSGSYSDLTDAPEIPSAQIQSDWNQTDNTSPDFIKNKPEISSGDFVLVSGFSIDPNAPNDYPTFVDATLDASVYSSMRIVATDLRTTSSSAANLNFVFLTPSGIATWQCLFGGHGKDDTTFGTYSTGTSFTSPCKAPESSSGFGLIFTAEIPLTEGSATKLMPFLTCVISEPVYYKGTYFGTGRINSNFSDTYPKMEVRGLRIGAGGGFYSGEFQIYGVKK